MKRLIFIVEGDTEISFVHKRLIPYLLSTEPCEGVHLGHAQKITTNRKRNKRGGNVNFSLFKNEVRRVAAQRDVLITTMLDFFRLPGDFPRYTKDSKKVSSIETAIRDELSDVIFNPFFLPYIQLHEVEALLFSNPDAFKLVVKDDVSLQKIKDIARETPNPEDINNDPNTVPSKRLEKIFPYQKTNDAELVFNQIEIDTIHEKCPRFNHWVAQLEIGLKTGCFLS